jgi:hypothetical protein
VVSRVFSFASYRRIACRMYSATDAQGCASPPSPLAQHPSTFGEGAIDVAGRSQVGRRTFDKSVLP